MFIQTGMRTDIPAFYSKWLVNRVNEGFVLVRNPYKDKEIIRYSLSPDVVDVLGFCSKNPIPLIPYLDMLRIYREYWHITITPYGNDIEPNVPDKGNVIEAFKEISRKIGKDSIAWRYDPIFISDKYSLAFHLEAFSSIASKLKGYTDVAIISFIDLYEKTKRNFPEAREVCRDERIFLASALLKIARKNNMVLKSCAEGDELKDLGVDTSGCMTQEVLERATEKRFSISTSAYKRKGCNCILCSDIGAYNSCPHLCAYCYANNDKSLVERNYRLHDPESPLLIGKVNADDIIYTPRQSSWIDKQGVFDFI